MKIAASQNYIGEWTAIDADTYDCDCDQDGFFSTSPVGCGKTEQDAIADLLDQIEEDDGLDSEGYPIGSPREWSEEELHELRRRERACDNYGASW